jgi:hypothetical protein
MSGVRLCEYTIGETDPEDTLCILFTIAGALVNVTGEILTGERA